MTPKVNDVADKGLSGYYRISLGSIGDGLDVTLSTVLETIGEAIAASTARIDTIGQRYGEDAADMAADDEIPVIEDFLGIAFVVCQAYITNVVTRLQRLHAQTRRRHTADLTTTTGSKESILRHGFRPTMRRPYSRIEVLNAYANYYKHRDEWDADWENRRARHTAAIISTAGASPSSTGNLRQGARYLGNRKFKDVAAFMRIFSQWRKKLVQDYEAEIRRLELARPTKEPEPVRPCPRPKVPPKNLGGTL
jgi:hypothetical protein